MNIKDRKSTRLNSSHGYISYAVFCLKKKKKITLAYLGQMPCCHTPSTSRFAARARATAVCGAALVGCRWPGRGSRAGPGRDTRYFLGKGDLKQCRPQLRGNSP